MVRRTREAAAATREQLLDAAERVFRDRGVPRTSLAEVAAEAGVTRGAVYWHFRDKADLFVAMCERATSPLDALIEQARGTHEGSPLAALRLLCIDALAHLSRDTRAHAVFEIRECANARACVETVIRRAVAAGELPRDTDATLATFAIHAYVTGLMHEWTHDPDAFDLRAAAPALIDAFIAGVVANPPRTRPAGRGAGSKAAAAVATAAPRGK